MLFIFRQKDSTFKIYTSFMTSSTFSCRSSLDILLPTRRVAWNKFENTKNIVRKGKLVIRHTKNVRCSLTVSVPINRSNCGMYPAMDVMFMGVMGIPLA